MISRRMIFPMLAAVSWPGILWSDEIRWVRQTVHGIALDVPAGWRRTSLTEPVPEAMFAPPGSGAPEIRFSVYRDFNIADVKDAEGEGVRGPNPIVKPITIDGHAGTRQDQMTPEERIVSVFFENDPRNTRGNGFVFSCPKLKWSQWQPVFEAMLASIRFVE